MTPLNNTFDKNAQISRLEINTFFVEKTKRHTKTDKPIYALYMTDITGRKTEWVESVEKFFVERDGD